MVAGGLRDEYIYLKCAILIILLITYNIENTSNDFKLIPKIFNIYINYQFFHLKITFMNKHTNLEGYFVLKSPYKRWYQIFYDIQIQISLRFGMTNSMNTH